MSAIITVDDLVKCYKRSDTPAVDHISFHVDEGEFFAFLGPNGAGKTTTISILTTTLSKTAGSVHIAGFDLDRQMHEVRDHIGIIFQMPSLDPQLSVEENIRLHACLYGLYPFMPTYKLMPRAYKDQLTRLADVVGLEEVLNTKISKLSGGMRRKLEIMRSMVHTPHLLFLDEPTQGLDAVSRRKVWDYLGELRQTTGMTIFLTTHYIEEADDADRLCLVDHGQLRYQGRPDQLKAEFQTERLEDAYVDLLLDRHPSERKVA